MITIKEAIEYLETLDPSGEREGVIEILKTIKFKYDRMGTKDAGDFYFLAINRERWIEYKNYLESV